MSNKNGSLASLFLEFHENINSKSYNAAKLRLSMSNIKERVYALAYGTRSKIGAEPSKPVNKKNTATAGSTNKKPIVKGSFTKTAKPTSPKPKLSIWDRVKRKRKATGDVIADKVQKQREDREDKPKKKL